MSRSFTYELDGESYEGGWEMSHGMLWLSFRGRYASTPCGSSLEENQRNRDNAMHQLLVLEGLAQPIPGQVDVQIKLGWD